MTAKKEGVNTLAVLSSKLSFTRIREGSFSEISGSKLATNIPFYSAQSSVAPVSCSLLPGYSHTCCEDLLRGATGCCSRVAGDFRHLYPSYYVFERRWWLWRQVLVYEFLPLNAVVHGQGGFENAAVLLYAEGTSGDARGFVEWHHSL